MKSNERGKQMRHIEETKVNSFHFEFREIHQDITVDELTAMSADGWEFVFVPQNGGKEMRMLAKKVVGVSRVQIPVYDELVDRKLGLEEEIAKLKALVAPVADERQG